MESKCLNCLTANTHKFCPNCGQKASTHRYSIVHFIEHDFIHGVWHVDRGVLFTLKELLTRPGHSVREYIQGKRANYFSFVTLILLLIAISSLLAPYIHIKVSDLNYAGDKNSREVMNSLEGYIAKYPKLFILTTIPINALLSFVWFRKAKLNYSEHLVLNAYKASFELIAGLVFSLIIIICPNIAVLKFIYFGLLLPGLMIYGVWFYAQLFSAYDYSKKALIFRSILVIVSLLLIQVLVGGVWAAIQLINH